MVTPNFLFGYQEYLLKLTNAPINVKPQGGGVGHGVGILTFSFKII